MEGILMAWRASVWPRGPDLWFKSHKLLLQIQIVKDLWDTFANSTPLKLLLMRAINQDPCPWKHAFLACTCNFTDYNNLDLTEEEICERQLCRDM